jgi:hypothetical protein
MIEPPASPVVDLRGLFIAIQEELVAALKADRAAFDHPSTRGETTELSWVTMLAKYLPARYKADKAFVVDADGRRSHQIDLVIYDRQHFPFLFSQHGNHLVPAESVYAVFEIKQTLSREHVIYAGDKAASVRALRRTVAPIYHAGGVYAPHPLSEIIAGILTLESDWNPPLGDSFREVLEEQEPEERLDLGCVLQGGAFEVRYDREVSLTKSTPETALVFFFFSLLRRLQAIGIASAMDVNQYGRFAE